MTTIRGVYADGEIKLLEKSPISGTKNVLVTFIDEGEVNDEIAVRNITLQIASQQMKEYIEDVREDLYQDYVKK